MIFRVTYLTPNLNIRVIPFNRSGLVWTRWSCLSHKKRHKKIKKGDRLLFLYKLSTSRDSPPSSRKSSLSPFLRKKGNDKNQGLIL